MATRAPRAPAQLAAYVLHRYDWSETSLILEVFTRQLGRIALVAKGAKRPSSSFRPVLLPLQPHDWVDPLGNGAFALPVQTTCCTSTLVVTTVVAVPCPSRVPVARLT